MKNILADWLINNFPTISLSSAALIISVRSWYKNRIFYDLDIHQISGNGSERQIEEIKKKLNTGKYTILTTYEETHDGNRNTNFIIVGKIRN